MESVSSATPKTKPTNSIVSRLKSLYGNLHAYVSRRSYVKTITSQNENGPNRFLNGNHVVRDVNNNDCFVSATPRQD